MLVSEKKLRNWFLQNARDFPWRNNPTPYEVWISEVMLQQTQAARVVGYYKQWMKRFPTIEILAKASLDEVLKHWEGLGYYARCRSLHAAAHDIVDRFQGKIPQDIALLESIKGLGPYTIGAILAFGYKQKQAAVDANVVRVLTRYFAIADDISKANTIKKLRERAHSLLPDHDSHIISEALIELGATVCKKKPECQVCPLQNECKSYLLKSQNSFPVNSKKISYQSLFRDVAVISCDDYFLLRQGKRGIACSGLYEFCYFDSQIGGRSIDDMQKLISCNLQLDTTFEMHLDEEKHGFTRYRATLYPKLFIAKEKKAIDGHTWFSLKEAERLTFSSGHKRIINNIFKT